MAEKRSFDVLLPFRAAWNFATGTLTGGLNNFARGGRLGFSWGLVLATAAFFLTPQVAGASLLAYAGWGAVTGLVGGAALGGLLGTATGGITHVAEEESKHRAAAAKAPAADKAANEIQHAHAETAHAKAEAAKAKAQAEKAERRAAAIADPAGDHPATSKSHGFFRSLVEASRAAPAQEKAR